MDLHKVLSPVVLLSRLKQRLCKVDETASFVLSGSDLHYLFFCRLAGVAKLFCLRWRIIFFIYCLLLFNFSFRCVFVCVCEREGGGGREYGCVCTCVCCCFEREREREEGGG